MDTCKQPPGESGQSAANQHPWPPTPSSAGTNLACGQPISDVPVIGGRKINKPARQLSAADFETSSGSRYLNPVLIKTGDGKPSFVPQSISRREAPSSSERAVQQGREGPCEPGGHESGWAAVDIAGQLDGEVGEIFQLVKSIANELDFKVLSKQILKNISVAFNADRSSLFLVHGDPDDPDRCLRSQIFDSGNDSGELADKPAITLPWGAGIAGYVAKTGESVNIVDCSKDARFDDGTDRMLNYETRNMLCAPMLDKSGTTVGVAQVINKRDGSSFADEEMFKLSRYLQFCGIALRNAQMHEQCELLARRSQVLLNLAQMVLEDQSSIGQILERIMVQAQLLLDCERCQVLLSEGENAKSGSDSSICGDHGSQRDCISASGDNTGRVVAMKHGLSDWPRLKCGSIEEIGRGSRLAPIPEASVSESIIESSRAEPRERQQPCTAHELFPLEYSLERAGDGKLVIYERRVDSVATRWRSRPSETASSASAEPQPAPGCPFPIVRGIMDHVASTGETLNISDVHEQKWFDSGIDEGSTFRHRSILCMPIRNSQGQIIGLIQLVNKNNGLPFNKNDIDLLEGFAVFCGIGIRNTLMHERVVGLNAKQQATFEVLADHAKATPEDARRLCLARVASYDELDLGSLKFDDFKHSADVLHSACMGLFRELGLIHRFKINQLVFCNWILSVSKGYSNVANYPRAGGSGSEQNIVYYHNWRHAFNVAQMMFAILKSTKLCAEFEDTETLALMIACLCHDLGHRCTADLSQIKCDSLLAKMYSTSTLEHHHFDQCMMILNSGGSQILANLTHGEYKRVIELIREAIIATDLANYAEIRDEFSTLAGGGKLDWRNNCNHRSLLRRMLMTAADIGCNTKPFCIQQKVAKLIWRELGQQGATERGKLAMAAGDSDGRELDQMARMQVEFIRQFCRPLYKALAKLFPEQLFSLETGCRENLSAWQRRLRLLARNARFEPWEASKSDTC